MSLPGPAPALVTGAGGTVGGEIAVGLSAAGHAVALTDRDGDALRRTRARLDGPSLAVAGDATVRDDVDRIVAAAEGEWGTVGVLVNALGVYGPRRPFVAAEPDDWWRVLEVNLRGPALFLRRVLPGMVEQGRGHVVNLNSRAATWDDPGQSSTAYSASKAALARLTGAVAAEVAGTGVVVVDLSPGMVRSGMTATRPDVDTLTDDRFVDPARAAAAVEALVSGRHDALHGRFVHALDDLDDLCVRLADQPGARTLTLAPTHPDDPVA